MNYCPNCGSPLENGRCPNCGFVQNDNIIDGDAVEKESKVINDLGINEFKEKHENRNDDWNDLTRAIPSWIKILLIIMTIIFPLLGLICSIALITRPYPFYKSFGIKLLILSIILLVLSLVFGIIRGVISLFIVGLHSVTM
ncbi:MAG: hypothetical protein LKJ25_11005 [Clostridia bacterium]|jgi:hypothetical protein|nr:hypothetical protein [Clostridia bacterium]